MMNQTVMRCHFPRASCNKVTANEVLLIAKAMMPKNRPT